MKSILQRLTGILFLLLIANARATNLFVDLNCANPTPPYADWPTAATNIQDAISASAAGDTIFVTNGIYSTGGKTMDGVLTNRVALDKAITVQSVNGALVTIIQGAGITNSPFATRCAWLTNNASLVGFTLQFGATELSGPATAVEGGGVWCASSNATVANCIIKSNNATISGGGAFQGTLNSCLICSNYLMGNYAAGACNAILNNCTVVGNSNGGIYQSAPGTVRVTNCIVYYNQNENYGGGGVYSHCCTTPAPSGAGNFTSNPQLFADGVHLTISSPCIGSGTTPVTSTDLFGKAWANPPAVGCAEFDPSPLVGKPQLQLTGEPVGFTVGNAAVSGQPPLTFFWTKDGIPLQDNGHFNFTQTTNLVASGVNYSDAGNYQLVVSNASGVVTSAVAQLVIHCVNISGTNPLAPYSTWANAATNIQDAITAAAAGEIVLVTNGIYASGGKYDGSTTNRVMVDKAILVQSLNGPNATIIQGAWNPGSTNGPSAIRCVWMTNNTTLRGFTIRGGATASNGSGGGVFGAVSNVFTSPSTNTLVANCLIISNAASSGGGASRVTLIKCTITNNFATSSGGGADRCNLKNCVLARNSTSSLGSGGGSSGQYSSLYNCTLMQNSAPYGAAANSGTLVNCTITANNSTDSSGAAVYGATLVNCIVWGNLQRSYSSSTANYIYGTLSYCCADPLASGTGNIFTDPQLLADGIHISQSSPCRAAGLSSAVVGADIDDQTWNNPPSIGCDEWQPEPLIAIQPVMRLTSAYQLTFNVVAAGQAPCNFFWFKDGMLIQDDTHYSDSDTANLAVNNFGLNDAGTYQVIVSNSVGVVTSQVAQVVIHVVDVTGENPIAPYSTWSTAATNIQDAINIASAGDIVLVTNGIYSSGGKVMAGDLTNRVALDKAIAVTSVNGPFVTIIQGAWDPASTNGPGAVRCTWLADGAMLNGFTLRNGATRAWNGYIGLPPQSGGGAWCSSTNAVVSNCVLSNNAAIYGAGIAYGTLNNSLVTANTATYLGYGGGAFWATLNNCTVVNNATGQTTGPYYGAGTYNCAVRNSIVLGNLDSTFTLDNYYYGGQPGPYYGERYSYSCSYPLPLGTGNLDGNSVNPQFLDLYHIAATSPCRGAGNALYTSGTDLDSEPWQNPPSMGCDEVIVSNLVGPLSVNLRAYQTNLLVNRYTPLSGLIAGRASRVEWSFGDGPTVTNLGAGAIHSWTNSGDYTVTFTAYNNDNLAGVSTNLSIHVEPLVVPQLQSALLLTNGFQFQFPGQSNANYTIQYTTNLALPITWQTLGTIYNSSGTMQQITDSTAPIGTRFYRVLAQ